MVLFMKERDSAFKDRFFVKDEEGKECYYIEGKLLSLNKKLTIFDADHREQAVVQKKPFALRDKYAVLVEDEEVAEISKDMALFKPFYKVEGPNWTVDGDIWDRDYKIRRNMNVIAEVSRPLLLGKDTYKIEIHRNLNPVMVLAVVLAIDCILEAEGEDAVSANNKEK